LGCLQYGSGLRLKQSLRVRVKDLDFVHRAVVVRNGKGDKDRVVTLTDELIVPLQRQAVRSPLGATLRLNPGAVREQGASRDTDKPKREPPDD